MNTFITSSQNLGRLPLVCSFNDDIARFEELNEHVSLNVFEVDNETVDVVRSRKPKSKDAKCHIDLRGIDGDDTSQHACKKDCSRL